MKRMSSNLLIFCIVLASFAGCGKAQLKNYVTTKILSEDQKQIVDLLSAYHKVFIFDLHTEEKFKSTDFWVETYKDGKLVDSRAAGIAGEFEEEKAIDGEFGVMITQTPDFQWTLTYTEKGGGTSTISEPNTNYLTEGNAACTLNQPVEIEDGKEIVLYAAMFRQDGKYRTYDDLQSFVKTFYFAECDYAHVVKCKFTK